jgi:hypothetical protein
MAFKCLTFYKGKRAAKTSLISHLVGDISAKAKPSRLGDARRSNRNSSAFCVYDLHSNTLGFKEFLRL